MKANILDAQRFPLTLALPRESERMIRCGQTGEHREAIRAWLQAAAAKVPSSPLENEAMSIAITEDHRQLGQTVRSFLDKRGARATARALLESADESRPDFWAQIAELGWLGLHIPERFGGAGYGLPELAVVVEQFGRTVAPGPFVPTVIASATIAACGDSAAQEDLLARLADGTLCAGTGFETDLTLTDTTVSGDAGVVLGAGLADVLLLKAGDDVVVLDARLPGVTIDAPTNLDPTRRSGSVELADVPRSEVTVLRGAATLSLALARTLIAAEAVGGAQDSLQSALEYAKIRTQFGRTIGSFQAIKHHLANMLVSAEAALSTVWDAARAADGEVPEFQLMAACAATLALPAYVRNAELNIQIHGGIGYTWEHDAHLHLRRAVALRAVLGGRAAPEDAFALWADGVTRHNSIDLPPKAEQLRHQVRADIAAITDLDDRGARARLIETGYLMPHWPQPWGRAADAVEQLVIEQELSAAGIKRPDLSITGWVMLTLIQHGSSDQIERFVRPALLGEEFWCQLFSEPGAGSDAAAVSTKATRVDGGWLLNGQKVWTSLARDCHRGLATVRTDPAAPKHAGITAMIIDMAAAGVEVRPLRQITGESDFNEVFFADVFVSDGDVVGEPNKGWTVARATLGNERVSLGGGSLADDEAARLLLVASGPFGDRVSGAAERTGHYVAEKQALRLLNLRRAVRSIAGAEPGPEGNVTKLLLAEHVAGRATLLAELLGPDVALGTGMPGTAGAHGVGRSGPVDCRRDLGNHEKPNRRTHPRTAARPTQQMTRGAGGTRLISILIYIIAQRG